MIPRFHVSQAALVGVREVGVGLDLSFPCFDGFMVGSVHVMKDLIDILGFKRPVIVCIHRGEVKVWVGEEVLSWLVAEWGPTNDITWGGIWHKSV